MTLPAQTFTRVLSFSSRDGYDADGALVQGTDGNHFGTAYVGGAYNAGTVFKITPSGLTAVYSFCPAGVYRFARTAPVHGKRWSRLSMEAFTASR